MDNLMVQLLIGLLAIATATAVGFIFRLLIVWLKRKVALVDLQDFNKPVTKAKLSWRDASEGISKKLLPDAQNFSPDFIFGINRGGAIVGGILAKNLGIPQVIILDVNLERDPKLVECRDKDSISGYKKLLLVDDALRTGGHMTAAVNYLRQCYGKDFELRRQVILQMMMAKGGPESHLRIPIADCYAFYTNNATITLPWDP